MKYVLIIITSVYGGFNSSQHTYNTKEACEAAKIEVANLVGKIRSESYQSTACVSKGEGDGHD